MGKLTKILLLEISKSTSKNNFFLSDKFPIDHNYVALASSSKSELVAPVRGSFVGPSNLKSELRWNIEII